MPSTIQMFSEKINKDRLSDMLATACGRQFADFTFRMAHNYNLPLTDRKIKVKYWDTNLKEIKEYEQFLIKAPVECKEEYVILVPKNSGSKGYEFQAKSFLLQGGYINDLQQRLSVYGINGKIKKTNKTEILADELKNSGMNIKKFALEKAIENPSYMNTFIHYRNKQIQERQSIH